MLRRRAHRLASVLERGAHRLALKLKLEVLKRGVTQARILMLKRNPEGLHLKEQHNHRIWQRLRGSRLRLERDLCV